MNYNQTASPLMGAHINNNVLDRLKSKLSHLQIELNKTQEAITALESNPDLVKVLDAIQGGLY